VYQMLISIDTDRCSSRVPTIALLFVRFFFSSRSSTSSLYIVPSYIIAPYYCRSVMCGSWQFFKLFIVVAKDGRQQQSDILFAIFSNYAVHDFFKP